MMPSTELHSACHPASRGSRKWRCSAVLLCVALCVAWTALPAQAQTTAGTDLDYDQLLRENPEYREDIEALQDALADDPEAEESFLAYQDSVDAYPELAEHQAAYYEALAEDSLLSARAAEFGEAAAADPEAEAQLATFDSLMAADEGLAERMEALEVAAAEDADGFGAQAEAIATVQANSELAEEIFSDEAGPSYSGANPQVVVYVDYLRAHPKLYRARWRLHHYARARPPLARALHAHWRWWHPRRALWRSWWRYRLHAARNDRTHRIIWERRTWLGRRPALARGIWHHRLLVARRPALRRPASFHHRHPHVAKRVIHHRRVVRPHAPPGHKTPPPKHKPKPKPKPLPRRR